MESQITWGIPSKMSHITTDSGLKHPSLLPSPLPFPPPPLPPSSPPSLKVAFSSDFNQEWDCKKLGLKHTTNTSLSYLASTSLKSILRSFSAPILALFPVSSSWNYS